jgi:hypothetical protein
MSSVMVNSVGSARLQAELADSPVGSDSSEQPRRRAKRSQQPLRRLGLGSKVRVVTGA